MYRVRVSGLKKDLWETTALRGKRQLVTLSKDMGEKGNAC